LTATLGFAVNRRDRKERGMTYRSNKPGTARRPCQYVSAVLALLLPIVLGAPIAAATPRLLEVAHFQFEQQARQHCPSDSIVWAIARLGIYNSNADRWYGQTSDGVYACRLDAETAGYHASGAAR
jgi:hypothetical protein